MRVLVFDVESIGLHGESFAVGAVLTDMDTGEELAHFLAACDPASLKGDADDKEWVAEHVPAMEYAYGSPEQVRAYFWAMWLYYHEDMSAHLAADCNWPVEARFLNLCVDANRSKRKWCGPYPFIDIGSVRLGAGLDPLGEEDRLPSELPKHNPLADARQSARLLYEALKRSKS